jgi:hypothetical protein
MNYDNFERTSTYQQAKTLYKINLSLKTADTRAKKNCQGYNAKVQ